MWRSSRRFVRRCLASAVPMAWHLPLKILAARFNGAIEPELFMLKRWADPCRTAVDVGANQGVYCFYLGRWFKNVEAFEPNAGNTAALLAYRSPGIHLHHLGLSSARRRAVLHVPVTKSGVQLNGWASLDRRHLPEAHTSNTIEVLLETLDTFSFENISVLKIDVEGHEMEVLQGARETIELNRPVLLVEIKREARKPASDFFDGVGYSAYVLAEGELLKLQDGLANYSGDAANIFALPD